MQVKLAIDPTFEEFRGALQEFKPTLLYVAGSSSYEQNHVTGLVGPVQFKGAWEICLGWDFLRWPLPSSVVPSSCLRRVHERFTSEAPERTVLFLALQTDRNRRSHSQARVPGLRRCTWMRLPRTALVRPNAVAYLTNTPSSSRYIG